MATATRREGSEGKRSIPGPEKKKTHQLLAAQGGAVADDVIDGDAYGEGNALLHGNSRALLVVKLGGLRFHDSGPELANVQDLGTWEALGGDALQGEVDDLGGLLVLGADVAGVSGVEWVGRGKERGRGEGGKGGGEREREKYVRDEDGCKRGREMEMGATFKGAVTRVVALAAQLPRGEPFSRKGRVGEDKPPPCPHGPWPTAPPAGSAPIGNISRRHRPHTPDAARHTPHAPVGHVRDLLLLLLPSGHDALFLVAHCGWSVGWSFWFLPPGAWWCSFDPLWGSIFTFCGPANLSPRKAARFWPGRGGGGGGGGYAPHHAASKEYVYVPSVRTLRYTYIHTYH